MIMNFYRLTFKLETGEVFNARAFAENPLEAQHRILDSDHVKEFLHGTSVQDITVVLDKYYNHEIPNPYKFDFRCSEKCPDLYVVTDKENMVVLTFKKGRLYETQRLCFLKDEENDQDNPVTTLDKFVNYLEQYHPEVL